MHQKLLQSNLFLNPRFLVNLPFPCCLVTINIQQFQIMLQLKFPQGVVVRDAVKYSENCRVVTGKEEI